MEFPYINWMQIINLYETPTHLYLVGSDPAEQQFRVLKIARTPVPLVERTPTTSDPCATQDSSPTIEAESLFDRLWRLSITADTHLYTKSEIARLLHIIQAASRRPHTDLKTDETSLRSTESGSGRWPRLGGLFRKKPPTAAPVVTDRSDSGLVTIDPSALAFSQTPRELQQSVASGLTSGTAERSLFLSTKCHGIAGVVRFLRGYYLILITKCRVVAQIGEHKIFKVEDTSLVYIPGNDHTSEISSPQSTPSIARSRTTSSVKSTQEDLTSLPSTLPSDGSQRFLQQYNQSTNRNRLMVDELRYTRLFNSVDLADNFYFSYTYDLSHTLQYNLQPVLTKANQSYNSDDDVWAVKPIPNDRFVWNWRLIPPRFRPDYLNQMDLQPDWFTLLYHGTVSQAALSACGTPLYITLIGRRSRHFAGPRFLKRGVNLVGDVANEVETEQIVNDTSHALLRNSRCSSYVQLRGSVPLFWSQEPGKLVVGRPPIELLREDPYFEAFGAHFANLLERHGSPIVVFNLMKRREKRKFELPLSEGFERGLAYLSQFLPSSIPLNTNCPEAGSEQTSPPILYIAFDIARVQKHKSLVTLEELRPVVESCVKRTGIFFTPPSRHLAAHGPCHRQCGLIRVNCVDCLDRTNTAQFVIGRVVLAHQLYTLGFLTEPSIEADSKIERLLQNLYDEHGDTLALQYGGSQLVHNIDTYKKTRRLSSQSRDFVQTLSRYYANKFSDWDKQCSTNLFLRIYRPIAWTGTLFQLACEQLYHMCVTRGVENSQCDGLSNSAFDSNADAIFTALAAASGGPIWDVTTDSHMHWLDSWSRLPANQRPLTDWCSRELLESLPRGLESVKKSELLAARAIKLKPDDRRVDWFSERYQPDSYQRIDRTMVAQVRWVELLVHPPCPDFAFSHASPPGFAEELGHTDHDVQPHGAYIKHHSIQGTSSITSTTDYSAPSSPGATLSSPFTRIRSTQSVPNLAKWPKTDRHITGQKPSLHPTLEEDEGEDVSSPSPVRRTQNPKTGGKPKTAEDKKAADLDESSSDSDSVDSTCSFLKVFPPMIALTSNTQTMGSEASQQNLATTTCTSGCRHANHARGSFPSVNEDYIAALRSWSPLESQYDPNAANAFLKPVDIVSYQRYVEFQCGAPALSGTNLKSTILVPPSKKSMEIYQNHVKLLEGGKCSVPTDSMEIYRASVMVADALHC